MSTAQINNKIHDITVARWKMLPIAVQREHDILGMCFPVAGASIHPRSHRSGQPKLILLSIRLIKIEISNNLLILLEKLIIAISLIEN